MLLIVIAVAISLYGYTEHSSQRNFKITIRFTVKSKASQTGSRNSPEGRVIIFRGRKENTNFSRKCKIGILSANPDFR